MLVDVLRTHRRKLGRGAALLLLTGMAAGCSSQVARFNTIDDIFTGSTENQRQIIKGSGNQPYPGDTVTSAAPAEPMHTGSVSRNTLAPVSSQPYPAPVMPDAAAPVRLAERQEPTSSRLPAAKPIFGKASKETEASKPQAVATKPSEPAIAADRSDPAGWSRTGGTQVTVREGETAYNLSRRYGVPANVIAQVNGMPAGNGLQAGQKIVIPTYGSKKAPASAPDSDAKVAEAKSNNGKKSPEPVSAPESAAAVLPKAPKAKDAKVASAEASGAKDTKKPAAAGGYTVQSGDTLSRIAKKTGVSVAALKSANGLEDGVLKIGQALKVPAASGKPAAVDQTVTASTPPPKKATEATTAEYTPPKKSEVMEQAEASTDAAPNATGIGKMRWPVRGRVVSGYGKGGGKSNDGIDIAVPEGTAIKAAENGVVIYAGDGLKEFGNTVLVRHENGLVTVYGNASSLNVKRGEKVKRGQDIALSGMSGNADSPKLHFEVRKNSAPVDPSTFLE